MSEPIMADDDSPMMMTVGQYNAMVARTWEMAVQETIYAERERITQNIQSIVDITDSSYVAGLYKALELIKGETNATVKE
jgi:hypothetical protein